MTRVARRLLGALLLLVAAGAAAHEIRPAYLEINVEVDGGLEFRWRQPIRGNNTLALDPTISAGWLDAEPAERFITGESLIKVWTVPAPAEPLAGQRLRVRGLDSTITDALVRINYSGGGSHQRLLKAADPAMEIPGESGAGVAVSDYLQLGLGHIWSGADHLLYLMGLILLIKGLRALAFTITAFTLAHSVTLACAALGLARLPAGPVEAVIALSIVLVAVELLQQRRGQAGMASRAPWLMAFAFGLLHGFGFAGVLKETGLPDQAVAPALLLFNLGIEAGQLLFVAAVLTLLWSLRRYLPGLRNGVLRLAPYGIGTVASYWLVQRVALMIY